MASRAILIAVACCVIFVLAAGYRSTQLQIDANQLRPTPGRIDLTLVNRTLDQFERARFLNLDRAPEILRAQFLTFLQREPEAIAGLKKVVSQEPDNAEAWNALALAAGRADPALAARARRQLRRLDSGAQQ